MIRLAITATLLAASVSASAFADDVRFPYDATIASDNVYVRSGPGRLYYHTNKLNKDDRVVVRRHDPGGWYMIEPPPSAFSWVVADFVKTSGRKQGTITENDVPVWVGSEFGPEHDVIQQKLSINDTVEILGEETVQTPDKTVRMYKIVPPRYEYRWVHGKYVIPSDPHVRRQHDLDPFNVPSNAKSPDPADAYDGIHDDDDGPGEHHHHGDGEHARRGKAVQDNGPGIDVLEAEREQLRDLDDEFRAIVRQHTSRWEFAHLEDDYRDLYDAVERPAMKKQIALRLDAVERYQRIKAEYDEFIELTSATDWRERRLLAIQRRHAGYRGPIPTRAHQASSHEPTPVEPPRPRRDDDDDIQTMPPITVPTSHHPNPGTPGRPIENANSPEPPFDGAGVIQRATVAQRGAPQHVLLSPNGRILAYLQPEPGVNLDRYIGEQMGVHGKRWHRPDLRTDFITVRKLTPVRLIP